MRRVTTGVDLALSAHHLNVYAEAAGAKRIRLADEMKHIVAAVNAVQTALMTTADEAIRLQRLVLETDGLAESHHSRITDAGDVIDGGIPPDTIIDQVDAVKQEHANIKAELVHRVRQIVIRTEGMDNALADLLGRVEGGEISDGGATSLAEAARAGANQGDISPEIPGPPPNPPQPIPAPASMVPAPGAAGATTCP